MDYKKTIPLAVLALGLSSQLAAQADLFQMDEVSTNGLLVAEGADNKCGAGMCGEAKPEEQKAGEHKCAAGQCGAETEDTEDASEDGAAGSEEDGADDHE